MRNRIRRNAAILVGAFLLFVIGLSFFYVAAEAGHECEDEDCPICMCVEECENVLRQIGNTVLPLAIAFVPAIFVILTKKSFSVRIAGGTLVSRKVRLND